MRQLTFLSIFASLLLTGTAIAETENDKVYITHDLPYVDVQVAGKTVRIERIADRSNIIDLDYALTSRPCPPYCIQPIKLTEGVETIGELEVLKYLQQISAGNKNILVIDSRDNDWLSKGMIPGAMHIPWTKLYNKTAKEPEILELLTIHFGVVQQGKLLNFQDAKTLVLYCNGAWCGQSPTNIRALIALGYPADKLKWYRGGMQSWKSFGLTTIQPSNR